MSIKQEINEVFRNVGLGLMGVDHARKNKRVVGVRTWEHDKKGQRFDVTFSDGDIEITHTVRDVSPLRARKLCYVFLTGTRADSFWPHLLINQGLRHCSVVERVNDKVRLAYVTNQGNTIKCWRNVFQISSTVAYYRRFK